MFQLFYGESLVNNFPLLGLELFLESELAIIYTTGSIFLSLPLGLDILFLLYEQFILRTINCKDISLSSLNKDRNTVQCN